MTEKTSSQHKRQQQQPLIMWFENISMADVNLVGGKNASLGEMYCRLTEKGVRVPNGFAITAHAYRLLTERVADEIRSTLNDLDTSDNRDLAKRGKHVRELIASLEMPEELASSIVEAYEQLSESEQGQQEHEQKLQRSYIDVAVRSSATAEDLPDASFAGQLESFLNVRSPDELLQCCKRCFASLFTDRAICYRKDKHYDHFDVALSIGVQKMVRSDSASSGVVFTLDTESGFADVVYITAALGLGENVVQGAVNPDEFYVFKPTLATGHRAIISKEVGSKEKRMVYDEGKARVKNTRVPKAEQQQFCLSDDEVLQLAQWAVIIEQHYGKAMDIEWAKDGPTAQLYVVQARPETVHSQRRRHANLYRSYKLKQHGQQLPPPLVKGAGVGSKIGSGAVCVLKGASELHRFVQGAVLVAPSTDPDWEPIMKRASAVITDSGGRTCHAAIISRELGIPCIVGTNDATRKLKEKDEVTVDCKQGCVYAGILPFETIETDLASIPETRTKIMMIVGAPSQAFVECELPCSGVGLAREEFIVSSYIGVHPKALLDYPNVDKSVKKQIDDITAAYKSDEKPQFFVDRLAHGIGRIAAAFYPKPVVVRTSDFKTNEYANLIGGSAYEPKEDNPMLGWRGASRYYDEHFKDAFALECAAIRKARNEFGLTNIIVMIPFCRTVEEGRKVIATMAEFGLQQHADGLQVYAMCEIPSNVLLAGAFLDVFDGFSIGSNDLAQLTLGLDRDAGTLSHIADERDPSVRALIAQVIEVCNKRGKYIGICGQAPSDFPEFAEFLVEQGIQSIALNPDSVIETTLKVAAKEGAHVRATRSTSSAEQSRATNAARRD